MENGIKDGAEILSKEVLSTGSIDEKGLVDLMRFMQKHPVKKHVVLMPPKLWKELGSPDYLCGYEVRLSGELENNWTAIVYEERLEV